MSADGRVAGDLCAWAVRRRRASAPRCWPGSARECRGLPMRRRSNGCWMRWRAHLAGDIDLDGLLSLGTMSSSASSSSGLRRAGGLVEAQRPGDVGRGGVAAAAAHEGVVHQRVAIDARAGELQAERAGHRGLRPAGVGRAVAAGVAQHGAHRAAGRRAGGERGRATMNSGRQAGRRQVDHVVQPRRGPAEGLRTGACGGRSSSRRCWRPCSTRRRAGRRRPARTPGRRCRRRSSPPGSRSPRGRRRLRPGCAGLRPTIIDTAVRPASRPPGFQRVGDGADVVVQAALRQQAGGDQD